VVGHWYGGEHVSGISDRVIVGCTGVGVAAVHVAGVGRRQQWSGAGATVDRGGRGVWVGRGRLRARPAPGQSAVACARLARVTAHTTFAHDAIMICEHTKQDAN